MSPTHKKEICWAKANATISKVTTPLPRRGLLQRHFRHLPQVSYSGTSYADILDSNGHSGNHSEVILRHSCPPVDRGFPSRRRILGNWAQIDSVRANVCCDGLYVDLYCFVEERCFRSSLHNVYVYNHVHVCELCCVCWLKLFLSDLLGDQTPTGWPVPPCTHARACHATPFCHAVLPRHACARHATERQCQFKNQIAKHMPQSFAKLRTPSPSAP